MYLQRDDKENGNRRSMEEQNGPETWLNNSMIPIRSAGRTHAFCFPNFLHIATEQLFIFEGIIQMSIQNKIASRPLLLRYRWPSRSSARSYPWASGLRLWRITARAPLCLLKMMLKLSTYTTSSHYCYYKDWTFPPARSVADDALVPDNPGWEMPA